jgi:hypothetical protein
MTNAIGTGDLLLFSASSLPGLLIQGATLSAWNHVGIAVRLGRQEELYVLETNYRTRFDHTSGNVVSGVALVPWSDMQHRYSQIAVRRLLPIFRTALQQELTGRFILDFAGIAYPTLTDVIFSKWLRLYRPSSISICCTDLALYYYQYTVAPEYHPLTGRLFVQPTTIVSNISNDHTMPGDCVYAESELLAPIEYIKLSNYHQSVVGVVVVIVIAVTLVVLILLGRLS